MAAHAPVTDLTTHIVNITATTRTLEHDLWVVKGQADRHYPRELEEIRAKYATELRRVLHKLDTAVNALRQASLAVEPNIATAEASDDVHGALLESIESTEVMSESDLAPDFDSSDLPITGVDSPESMSISQATRQAGSQASIAFSGMPGDYTSSCSRIDSAELPKALPQTAEESCEELIKPGLSKVVLVSQTRENRSKGHPAEACGWWDAAERTMVKAKRRGKLVSRKAAKKGMTKGTRAERRAKMIMCSWAGEDDGDEMDGVRSFNDQPVSDMDSEPAEEGVMAVPDVNLRFLSELEAWVHAYRGWYEKNGGTAEAFAIQDWLQLIGTDAEDERWCQGHAETEHRAEMEHPDGDVEFSDYSSYGYTHFD